MTRVTDSELAQMCEPINNPEGQYLWNQDDVLNSLLELKQLRAEKDIKVTTKDAVDIVGAIKRLEDGLALVKAKGAFYHDLTAVLTCLKSKVIGKPWLSDAIVITEPFGDIEVGYYLTENFDSLVIKDKKGVIHGLSASPHDDRVYTDLSRVADFHFPLKLYYINY